MDINELNDEDTDLYFKAKYIKIFSFKTTKRWFYIWF